MRQLVLALLVLVPAALAAQGDVRERLAGRVPADVASAVNELAASAVARGLPVGPLVDKALEGSAKGVAPATVVQAVRALYDRLDGAAGALRAAGVATPQPAAIEAGAFALSAGLTPADVTAVADATEPPHALDATLRVAGTLAAMGVPGAQAVELVTQILEADRPPTDVLALPAQLQAGVARGLTPAQAAAGLTRAAAGGRAEPPARPAPGGPPGKPRPVEAPVPPPSPRP